MSSYFIKGKDHPKGTGEENNVNIRVVYEKVLVYKLQDLIGYFINR